MRRVVVTGVGAICPLSCSIDEAWEKLIAGESGIERITSFDVSDIKAQIAGQLPTINNPKSAKYVMNPKDWVEEKELGRIDKFILYALAASSQAISDAGIDSVSDEERSRIGVMIGSGIGGLSSIYETALTLAEKGPRRVSPFFIPSALINLASGQVSIKYGFSGPNHAVVTACSSGTHAIGDASKLIKNGEADIMVAGGSEAAVCRLGIAGFSAARSLSTAYNYDPHHASRPWDKHRDGFVMGEGSGILILEEYEHAVRRGAKIYAEVVGYGISGDAYHITAPPADGNGAYRAMKNALLAAELNPEDVDYINAHGTSTSVGDLAELHAVENLFGDSRSLSVSSTKSSIGHLLGAAGAVEAIFSILAMKNNVVPATLNLFEPESTKIDLVPIFPKEKRVDVAMSNSFGFGGTNSSLIFKKV